MSEYNPEPQGPWKRWALVDTRTMCMGTILFKEMRVADMAWKSIACRTYYNIVPVIVSVDHEQMGEP